MGSHPHCCLLWQVLLNVFWCLHTYTDTLRKKYIYMAAVLFRRHNSILLAGLLSDSQSHKVKKKTKPYLGAKSGLQATKLPSLKVSKMYITVMWAVCLPCECTSDWRVVKGKCCEWLRVSVEESSVERCRFIRQDLRRPRVATLSPLCRRWHVHTHSRSIFQPLTCACCIALADDFVARV